MQSKVRVIIPFRGPEKYEMLYQVYEQTLDKVSTFGNNKSFIHLIDEKDEEYKKIVDVRINIIYSSKYHDKEDSEIVSISNQHKFFHLEWISEFIELKFTFKHDLDEFSEIYINHIIKRFSLILHLSFNSKFDFLPGIIFKESIDDILGKTEMNISNIDMALGHALDIDWPKIQQPDFEQTINWFIGHGFHPDDLSQTNLQRAINAFSYSFSHNKEKDTSELFWTMIGIESLLAEGTNSIMAQIKTKSTIILGQPKEFKKKLQKLYDYRSRFVHGDLNFPPKFSSDFDQFERNYWDYSQFALSILTALIKKLIIENQTKFEFEYKRKN